MNIASEKSESDVKSTSPLKIAVYTCITQGYDELCPPLSEDKRLAYFCFSDSAEGIMPPWKFIPIELNRLSPKDQNRYIKMHPYEFIPDFDITVYIDGNIQIVGDLYELIQAVLKSPEDIFLYQHPWRNCIYAEAAECSHIGYERIWAIASQMRRYSKLGYPPNNGLFEAGVIIRKNTLSMRCFMNEWWSEYCKGAKRDQLSLPFVAWQLNTPLGNLGESDPRITHVYFSYIKHPIKPSYRLNIMKILNRTIEFVFIYNRLIGKRHLILS